MTPEQITEIRERRRMAKRLAAGLPDLLKEWNATGFLEEGEIGSLIHEWPDMELGESHDVTFFLHSIPDMDALLAEVERLTKDRDHWHDTYQADAGARDQLLAELLDALPGDHSEMLDAHAEVLNGVERLVKELTEIHGDIRFCLKVIFDGDWTRTESVLAARRSRLIGLSIPHGGVYDPKTPDGGETP